MNWHTIPSKEVLDKLGSSVNGLDDHTVNQKLAEYGRNELQSTKKISPVAIFFRQFLDMMILVLVVAAVISAFIGDITDTIVIVVILLLNAVIGFIQEYRAEKSMEALRQMATPVALVLRNNKKMDVDVAEIVPGDIVLLEAGTVIPADIRILESNALKIEEAALTGESAAVDKTPAPLQEADLPLGDRHNIAYKGTNVAGGNGRGIVVATGMQTELGKIAGMLEQVDSKTPLQNRLTGFSRKLTIIVILLCAGLFLMELLRGKEWTGILLTSLSLAVAAIPEALPAVVTISLAIGARRLMKQQVLIRKLYAVETLGSVTYICTDKTGTLTKNEMQVQEIWTPDGKEETLKLAMSLNHSVIEKDGKPSGDPTELAMLSYAETQKKYKRSLEIPFDAERKAMSTIHEKDGQYWVITKGAAETILELIADKQKEEIQNQQEKMAAAGLRVIGFAEKEINEIPQDKSPDNIEKGLRFVGLVGLMDPPREGVKDAIRECKNAGIIPVMITGDHPLTGIAIAKQIGIIESDKQGAVTGKEIQDLSEDELKQQIENIRVFARVSPEQKLRIIDTLQQKNEFVAMTGDGVNDAPSLKKANIGIAMGITGTDVSKEAAHMILLDDNFTTIVKAVKDGRHIYDNIRKFIKYILTGNSAELLAIIIAPLLGLPIPLLPVHILWVNLVTDGLPALALAAERAEKDLMRKPPRPTKENIFAGGLGWHVLWMGLFIGGLTVATQWYAINHTDTHWQTIVFTVLCFSQLWHVMTIRKNDASFFLTNPFSNRFLFGGVILTVLLQIAIIYTPFLNSFFHTKPLTTNELLACFGVSFSIVLAVEVDKWIRRRN